MSSASRSGLNLRMRNICRPTTSPLLVAIGRHPGDEVSAPDARLLLVGDRLDHHRRGDDLAEAQIAHDLELGVGRQRGDEAGLVERRRADSSAALDRRAAALGDARDLRRRHRPGLQHQRRRDDAAEARRRRDVADRCRPGCGPRAPPPSGGSSAGSPDRAPPTACRSACRSARAARATPCPPSRLRQTSFVVLPTPWARLASGAATRLAQGGVTTGVLRSWGAPRLSGVRRTPSGALARAGQPRGAAATDRRGSVPRLTTSAVSADRVKTSSLGLIWAARNQ